MIGKRKFVPALLAALAFGVVGVAPASAATQHWYVNGSKLAEGTPTAGAMQSTTAVSFKSTVGGLAWELKCSSMTQNKGTLENPTGGGAGVYRGVRLDLTGCTLAKPEKSGCVVKGGVIATNDLLGEARDEGPAVRFSPEAGETITEWTFEGCKNAGFNKSWSLTGSFTGIVNNTNSTLQFTPATSNIKLGGAATSLTATSTIGTEAGGLVTVAP